MIKSGTLFCEVFPSIMLGTQYSILVLVYEEVLRHFSDFKRFLCAKHRGSDKHSTYSIS